MPHEEQQRTIDALGDERERLRAPGAVLDALVRGIGLRALTHLIEWLDPDDGSAETVGEVRVNRPVPSRHPQSPTVGRWASKASSQRSIECDGSTRPVEYTAAMRSS